LAEWKKTSKRHQNNFVADAVEIAQDSLVSISGLHHTMLGELVFIIFRHGIR
jgi:hypothetical protein